MREFKGRLMTCSKCMARGGKVRHEPGFVDGTSHHILTSCCINCGNPKITSSTAVWTGLLDDLESGTMLFGRKRAAALREFATPRNCLFPER